MGEAKVVENVAAVRRARVSSGRGKDRGKETYETSEMRAIKGELGV